MGLHLGVTGSSEPILHLQELKLLTTLSGLHSGTFGDFGAFEWMHNGDCVNADHVMAQIWRRIGGKVYGHPPDRDLKRAFFDFDLKDRPFPYKVRDQHIVDRSDLIVGAPRCAEYLRSGTWMTIRMARKKGIPRILVWPDGTVTRELV